MSKLKISAGRSDVEISPEALKLLQNLAELQEAGLISADEKILVDEGYDEGSYEVDVPGTITRQGRTVLKNASEKR
jgi:hypothetical protein